MKAGGAVTVYGVDEYFSVAIQPQLAGKSFRFTNEGYAEWEATDAILRLIGEGRLNPGNFYDRQRIFPLEQINDAFAAAWRREMLRRSCSVRTSTGGMGTRRKTDLPPNPLPKGRGD